jgi:hypothetical protein
MSDILTIRVASEEKAQWEKAAAAASETMADYVRNAVRQRVESRSRSRWEKHIGSYEGVVSPPTNANVRRAMAEAKRSKR